MKKLLLGLGSVAAIAAPVASVIACGSTEDSVEVKNVTSTKTEAELKAIVLSALEEKEVSHLDSTFGITTGVNVNVLTTKGITYVDGLLTFKAGSLGEEKTYKFKITPKAVDATPEATVPFEVAITLTTDDGADDYVETTAVQAIRDQLKKDGKDLDSVKEIHMTVTLKDGTTKTDATEKVVSGSSVEGNINATIKKLVADIANEAKFAHVMGPSDAQFVAAIKKIGPITDKDKVNELFKAMGNGTTYDGTNLHLVLSNKPYPAADVETAVKTIIGVVGSHYGQTVQDALKALTFK